MAGTAIGGRKANATIMARMGTEAAMAWREQIGRKGGKISRGGGFADPKFASAMGKIGGAISKRSRLHG